MSAKYPYLDIAISVLDANQQPVNYSFNSAPTIAMPSLSDLARHFVNLSDGYVMWQIGGRRAFTYFQLNESGTQTVLAVTVRLDPDVLIAGRPIVNLLGTIRRTLSDDSRLTHESLMRALTDSGFPETPLRSDAEVTFPASATGLACRTYISGTELANIMAYPRQKDYARFQGIVVVPATVSMQPDSSIPLITEPLDKALMVVCPENVTASANCVELSDHLTLTYTMPGFDPQNVEFEVGTTNRYVRINGPALVVNSALHAGIIFTKSIAYSVKSPAGKELETYTILINGRTATRSEGSFEVSNTDFTDGKVVVSVSSTNYGSYSREFTPEELSEAAPLDIVLEPQSRKISLRLDFGNGRTLEDSITLEKNTPEYNSLRAGSFHGFRAHRMVGANTETYSVDMRQAAAGVAAVPPAAATAQRPAVALTDTPASKPAVTVPADETPVSRETSSPAKSPADDSTRRVNTPVRPAIEKAPSAIWEEPKHVRVTPKFENVADQSDSKTDKSRGNDRPGLLERKKAEHKKEAERRIAEDIRNDADTPKKKTDFDIRLLIIGVAVVACGLVIWWLILLFSGNDSNNQTTEQQPAESIEEVNYTESAPAGQPAAAASAQPATAAAAPVAAASEDEKADIQYLNTNSTWKLSELKSPKYRALLTAMKNGDIQAVVSNPYFAIAGTATNARALKVAEYLWNAKGTLSEKSNVSKLKDLSVDDKANIDQLYDQLSRRQPAQPNTEPRPGAK